MERTSLAKKLEVVLSNGNLLDITSTPDGIEYICRTPEYKGGKIYKFTPFESVDFVWTSIIWNVELTKFINNIYVELTNN